MNNIVISEKTLKKVHGTIRKHKTYNDVCLYAPLQASPKEWESSDGNWVKYLKDNLSIKNIKRLDDTNMRYIVTIPLPYNYAQDGERVDWDVNTYGVVAGNFTIQFPYGWDLTNMLNNQKG